jgi:hypothetical protein
MGVKVGKPGPWYSTKVTASIIYELNNTLGGYDEFRAKIAGAECMFVQSKVTDMKFNKDRMTCAKPVNQTKTQAGTLIQPRNL